MSLVSCLVRWKRLEVFLEICEMEFWALFAGVFDGSKALLLEKDSDDPQHQFSRKRCFGTQVITVWIRLWLYEAQMAENACKKSVINQAMKLWIMMFEKSQKLSAKIHIIKTFWLLDCKNKKEKIARLPQYVCQNNKTLYIGLHHELDHVHHVLDQYHSTVSSKESCWVHRRVRLCAPWVWLLALWS